mmetsp:Transcript_2625/g.9614  ORF Transcript_2625/g.9614 Transcript_2625/m.9614 type:complete len:147 (+) Transcript_2625:82-522(+)
MADEEEMEVEAPAAEEEEESSEPLDLMTALQLVLKKALAHTGLSRGLRESVRAIEQGKAELCVLAQNCDQADYTKLIKALCKENNVHLLTVPEAKKLGEWVGLCKLDTEGQARKVVGASSVVVTDYGVDSAAKAVVLAHLKEQAEE